MSTTPFPGPYPTTIEHILVHHITTPDQSRRMPRNEANVVRRRPSRQQGHALEVLGHAIEYLIDSDLYAESAAQTSANRLAAELLMRLSREVFAECREVVFERRSLTSRLKRLLHPGRAQAAAGDLLR